ncbi:DUF4190 domain-containing protein [Streptomyces sp. NPDC001941]|uniref:DUF4190 domain-containing protein n=1 Tax=Streptomyces sp. NPDC001941 TaxID=3154659 RepID=UPI003333A511
MSDHADQPPGGGQPDPWAPPESRTPQPGGDAPADKVDLGKGAGPSPVHDQQTMAAMPSDGFGPAGAQGPVPPGGAVPPPPIAPGGPAQTAPGAAYGAPAYGYPDPGYPDPGQPAAGAPYGYPDPGQPAAGSYGYPGYPGYSAYGQNNWNQTPNNGMGTAAMVLGIISVVGFCMYGVVGIVLGVLALIFGILARKRVQRGEANNGGMATAGIVLGSIGIVLGAAVIGFIIWAIANSDEFEDSDTGYDDPFQTSLYVPDAR